MTTVNASPLDAMNGAGNTCNGSPHAATVSSDAPPEPTEEATP
jgi:hypothetical protein